MIVALNVRDITQRNSHRVANFIRYTDAVQACRELTGVGSRDEQDRHRQRHEVFQRDIEHIKQLFGRDIVPPEQVAQHRAGAVQCGALVGVEQEDEQVVQNQKNKHEDQHKADFLNFNVAEFERRKADGHQPQQHPGVVGDHAGKGKQQKKRQLGGAGKLMHHTFARQVV